MDEDDAREKLKKMMFCKIRDTVYRTPQMFEKFGDVSLFAKRLTNKLIYLIASELEKAEKWDRIREIADNKCALNACPFFARCNDSPCLAEMIVDALEKDSDNDR